MKRKILACLLTAGLCVSMAAGCGGKDGTASVNEEAYSARSENYDEGETVNGTESVSQGLTEVPTKGMELDENILTGATAAANTVVLSLLGIDVTSSDGAGLYRAESESESYGTDSNNLIIFGSDINESPDAFIYNFYYNLHSTESGGDTYSPSDYSMWTATPYALIWGDNKAGPSGAAQGTVSISIPGMEEKTTNPAFYYEPDILLGGENNGYASELINYQKDYNAEYNPTIFLGYGTGNGNYAQSGTRIDGLGLEYNQFQMCAGVVYLGSVVQNLMNETGKVNRYDEGAYEIAVDYDKYDRGLYYYIISKIESGELTEVRYTSALNYNTDTDTYTVSKGSNREAQYASGIAEDIYDLLEDGYTFSDGTVIEKTEDTGGSGDQMGPGGDAGGGPGGSEMASGGTGDNVSAQGGAGGENGGSGDTAQAPSGTGGENGGTGNTAQTPGGGSGGDESTGGYLLTSDQLIEILNEPASLNPAATGVLVGSSASSVDPNGTLSNTGIRFLNSLPSCIYGMTMQTVENGMGIPFYAGFLYFAQDNSINPISYILYWMDNFYHVSDNDAMAIVVQTMLENSSFPAGIEEANTTVDSYDPTRIEEQIMKGVDYYTGTLKASYDDDESIGEDSYLYWTTLDTSVGIGSDVRETNVNYSCTSIASEADSYGNMIYSFEFSK